MKYRAQTKGQPIYSGSIPELLEAYAETVVSPSRVDPKNLARTMESAARIIRKHRTAWETLQQRIIADGLDYLLDGLTE